MKLVILHRYYFYSSIIDKNEQPRQVNKKALRKLKLILKRKNLIPNKFKVDLNIDAVAVFEFKSVSKELDIFYYDFIGFSI